jgi:hypothetical protein
MQSTAPFQLQDDQRRQRQQQQSQQQQAQVGPIYVEPISPALSTLDFMHLSSRIDKDSQPTSDVGALVPSPPFMHDQRLFSKPGGDPQGLDTNAMEDLSFGMHGNGWNSELPNYIDELLSGAHMY